MKKIYIVLFLIFTMLSSEAQWVTIPDTAFVNYLTLRFPSCMNGNQMDTTCSNILSANSVSVSGNNFSSLEGIQYFDSLRSLNFSGTTIASLPGLPATLTSLTCVSNALTSLPALPDTLQTLFCGLNQLTSLPALPSNLRSLRCEGNPITSLPALPADLFELYTGSCPLIALPPLPNTLAYLHCSFDTLLTSINSFPASLISFGCHGCNLTSLPALPSLLEELDVSYCSIASIPTLPSTLISLECESNFLTSLPALPSSLENLVCSDNQLTSLPALPSALEYLTCPGNQLASLPVLPDLLSQVVCDRNQLTTIPNFPDSLKRMFCTSNQITSLPPMNSSLLVLDCNRNQLDTLPTLPSSLIYLHCGWNQFTSLPNPNAGLQTLRCDSNAVTSLPALPASLLNLTCPGNLISSLPEFPDSMNSVYVYNNPLLTCLPELKKINALIFYGTAIQCLPDYGNVVGSNPPLNYFPLCDPFNANSCSAFWNIEGRAFADLNSDCVSDTVEMGLRNIKVQLFRNSVLIKQTFTHDGGVYSFAADTGSYTYSVDTTGLPFLLACPPTGFHTSVLTVVDSTDTDKNFGFNCTPGFDVGANSIVLRSPGLFPGDSATVNIGAGDLSSVYGMRCATGINGDVIVTLNGPVTFLTAAAGALTPVVAGNTLTYTIADFGTVNYANDFRFILIADTTSQIGDSLCVDVSVSPVTGDNDASNNFFSTCFMIGNSYDPNIKEVNPEGDIAADQDWLTYTIHFQNTGTAAAHRVFITDTLDANLQVGTFELIAYSHDVNTNLSGNKIEFDFAEINLPDSTTDEQGSHGYIQYRIKPRQGLSIGSQIRNKAEIYFDFNPPVITNTVVTNVSFPVGIDFTVQSDETIVYPNPATNKLYVISKNIIKQVELIDVCGKRIYYKENVNASSVELTTDKISRGIYFMKINNSRVRKILLN